VPLKFSQIQNSRTPERKMSFVFGLITLSFVGIFLKLFYLQILNYPLYHGLSNTNSLRLIPQRAPRGIITDRNGEVLATNAPTYSLYLVPAGLKTYEETLIRLSQILGEPLDSLRRSWKAGAAPENSNRSGWKPI